MVGCDARTGEFLPVTKRVTSPRSRFQEARRLVSIGVPGLVQEAFRDLGQAVPRDTDMQRDVIGAAVAVSHDGDLRRDDLIYVPGHVMICAGEGRVIHAYGGDMRVRQDKLAALMATHGWSFADFTIRRP